MGDVRGTIRRIDGGGEYSTTLEEDEGAHTRPHFLPDGERFLFYVPSKRGIYMAALDSKTRTFVRSADSGGIYVEPGYLLFVDGETLMAERFAPSSGTMEGRPFPLAHGVYSTSYVLAFSASNDVLAYSEGSHDVRLEWFDRDGR